MRSRITWTTTGLGRALGRGGTALLLACVLAGAASVAGAAADGAPLTATGEVVDLACYMPRGEKGRGPAHRECAEMCAKGGAPLGLLGADGSVLLLVEDHTRPAPYAEVKKLAGQSAEVAGTSFARGGLTALMVGSVKAE
jgi:hypothetical protein